MAAKFLRLRFAQFVVTIGALSEHDHVAFFGIEGLEHGCREDDAQGRSSDDDFEEIGHGLSSTVRSIFFLNFDALDPAMGGDLRRQKPNVLAWRRSLWAILCLSESRDVWGPRGWLVLRASHLALSAKM